MSKTRKLLVGLIAIQLFLPSLALAASSPEYVTPGNSLTYVEYNTGKLNPLSNQIGKLLQENIGKTPIASESATATAKLLQPYLDNTNIGLSQAYNKTDFSQIDFFSIAIPENVFQQIIQAVGTDVTAIKLPDNQVIYTNGNNDLFLGYKNGNIIGSGKKGIISDLLLVSNPTTISQNADFQLFKNQTSPESFFRGFLNFENIPSGMTEQKTISSWLKSEGFALTQTSDSLDGVVMVTPTADSPLNLTNFTFTPALYQKISAQNLLLYSESNNLATHFMEALNLLALSVPNFQSTSREIVSSMTQNTGLDPVTEIAPLFQSRTAIALHSDFDHQYYPAFSLITEVKGQEPLAKATLAKLLTAITKSMDASSTKYTTNTITTSNGDFKQIAFPNESYDGSTPDPKSQFSLSLGVTSDGQLVITTLSNPSLLFSSTGLASDTEWQSQFSSTPLIDLSFVNLINVRSYVMSLADKFGAPQDFVAGFTSIMAPLKSFYAANTIADKSIISHFRLRMDGTKLAAAIDYLKSLNWSNISGELAPTVENNLIQNAGYAQKTLTGSAFSDVDANSWFGPAVSKLADLKIMSGYGLNFKPDQPITRAEFIKAVMEAEYIDIGTDRAMDFNDVPENSWYYKYIKAARAMNIISGYADNTFHPDKPITRAEAIQILTNSDKGYFNLNDPTQLHQNLGQDHPFSDVRPSDWFYNSAYGAYWANVIKGKTATQFSPNTLLTRAEAAVIISRYLESY